MERTGFNQSKPPLTSLTKSPDRLQLGGPVSTLQSCMASDTRLNPSDAMIMIILAQVQSTDVMLRREGMFKISQGILALLSPFKRSAINKAIKRLTQAGYLIKIPRFSPLGGREACLYKIDYNVTVPAQFDRWQNLQHHFEEFQDIFENEVFSDVPTGTPPVPVGVRGVFAAPNGQKTAELSDVPTEHRGCSHRNTPESSDAQGGQKTAELSDVPTGTGGASRIQNLESFIKESKTKILELYPDIDISIVDVVSTFIGTRQFCFPDTKSVLKINTQIEAVKDLISIGIPASGLINIIQMQMPLAAKQYAGTSTIPNSIKFFKNDLTKRYPDAYLPKPKTTQLEQIELYEIPDDQQQSWDDALASASLADNDIDGFKADVAFAGLDGHTVQIIVISETVKTIFRTSTAFKNSIKTAFPDCEVAWCTDPDYIAAFKAAKKAPQFVAAATAAE